MLAETAFRNPPAAQSARPMARRSGRPEPSNLPFDGRGATAHDSGVRRCSIILALALTCLGGCSGEEAPEYHLVVEPGRPEMILDAIETFNARFEPLDRAAKYCKMAQDPYSFFRGTAHIFFTDVSQDPRRERFSTEDTITWIQGDMHAQNFGAFDDDRGVVVYDLNDFDDAIVADYQLDVWRLATSLELLMRASGMSDDDDDHKAIHDALTESYLDALDDFVAEADEQMVVVTEDTAYGLLDQFLAEVKTDDARQKMLTDWTAADPLGARTLDLGHAELEPVPSPNEQGLRTALVSYIEQQHQLHPWPEGYFNIKSIARRRNAGLGSLGMQRFYVLVEGPSARWEDDHILDVKEQGQPSAYPALSEASQAWHDEHLSVPGERVIRAQQALRVYADDHLGWLELDGRTYSIRDRSPYKETFPTSMLDSRTRFEKLAQQWGLLAAVAHARADEDGDPDLVPRSFEAAVHAVTDGEHKAFRKQVRHVAAEMANVIEHDHRVFSEWFATTGTTCPFPLE